MLVQISVPLEEDESGTVVEENTNISFSKTPGSEKKKKKNLNSQDFESTSKTVITSI